MLNDSLRIYLTTIVVFVASIAISIHPSWGQEGGEEVERAAVVEGDSLLLDTLAQDMVASDILAQDSLLLDSVLLDSMLLDSMLLDSMLLDSTMLDSLATSSSGRRGMKKWWIKDTSEVNRVRLPLESYYFSDSVRARENFLWSIDKDYNRVKIGSVDTTLNNWRIDYPYQKEGVGDMSLGGLGQASQGISQYDRADYSDYIFAQPFDSYIFTSENAPFYNVKRATTQFSYIESGQTRYRETNFGILHAQNISPSSGFAIDYKSRNTRGQYSVEDTKNHNLATTFYHTGKKYAIQAGYLNNDITTEESGGIVAMWAIRDSIFEMPTGVPMKLGSAAATNRYRNNTVFVKQSYGIPLQSIGEDDFSIGDKSAIYFGHTFEYNRWSKLYSDTKASYTDDLAYVDSLGNYTSETYYYYDNWFIDATNTRDSIMESIVSNRLFMQAQPWSRNSIVGTLDGGVGVDVYTYSQFQLEDYLSGKMSQERFVSSFVYGSAEGQFKRYLSWNANIKVHPMGYRMGDYEFGGEMALNAYLRDKSLTLSGAFTNELRSPNYWQENLFSNHYIFETPLMKENITRAEVLLRIPHFNVEVKANQLLVDNMIYYNDECLVTQQSGVTSVTSIYLRKNLKIKGLNLDHKVLAQWSSNEIVAPVPALSAYLSYYYEFWVEKLKVLRLQVGVDCRYTTRYYMPDYNPALSTFFNQRSESIGAYPYTDVYLSAKWKRMRILIKYQHINQYMYGNDEYFTVAGYPQNPGALKFGFSWMFYD